MANWQLTERILAKYQPLSETAFYILLSLMVQSSHGYGISKYVAELTDERIVLGSGTIYGTLNKMLKDGLVTVYADGERKKVYEITELGSSVFYREKARIKEVYDHSLTIGGDLS
ncbi:PadR family transcriptional regulator [Salisediminibacterium beveridgei]|uniref:PadR family transcriptional regulator n=1 Tax=Salisediminibacterium beveridgei TaxID=632773 RepID=UPI001E3FAD1E|nr:PadR family transcriptional regulator [Salisediminibacterium beveridgei]